jgi:hypothetical protein
MFDPNRFSCLLLLDSSDAHQARKASARAPKEFHVVSEFA